MERTIRDILFSNRSERASVLPMVHTAPAYYIQEIIKSQQVTPTPCDVFLGEELSYFFVGRPAYKSIGRDIQHWELPSCVIVDFQASNSKRMYPFDSGAFSKGFVPKYATMIKREDFELPPSNDLAERFIGTFFGTSERYFLGESVDKTTFLQRHGILPTEASLHALVALLNGERIGKELDERRSSIELQFDKPVSLDSAGIRAVILPEIYLKAESFIESIESLGAQVMTYPIFPLNTDHYYFALYQRCHEFYKHAGYYDV